MSNQLESYSQILQQQFEERRAREDAAYKQAIDELEETKCNIDALTDESLLDYLMAWYGTSDPRMTELNLSLREYAKQIALARMNRSEHK